MNIDYDRMVDARTGKRPTGMQLTLLKALNPFQESPTHAKAAKELGISKRAVDRRMANLKRRCPEIYKKYKELKKFIRNGEKKYRWLQQKGRFRKFQEHDDVLERF